MESLKEIYSNISDSEWRYICRERPELKKISPPTLDTIIVEFLKQYEVYVKPVTSGTRNRGESAMAGAITGIAGADVGGDAFLISGQKKQTAVQEWTQWKQWALNHKDFPAFRDIPNQKANKNNARVDELLATKEIQNDIFSLVKERRKSRKFVYAIYAIPLIIVGWAFYEPTPTTTSRTLRYSDFIEAVQEKQVSRVLISPDKGTAQIVKSDGNRALVNLAPDSELLQLLTDNEVEIAVQPTTQASPYQQAIGSLIFPIVFISGVIFFIFRLSK